MPDAILHSTLPDPPWLDPVRWRLPGMVPVRLNDWIIRDEVFDAQVALRDTLIDSRRSDVHAMLPSAKPAALECFELVVRTLCKDPKYIVTADTITRPDGVEVSLSRSDPLLTLGRLVQEDICLLEEGDHGHVLTGAILCFPAYWTLAEKMGRNLARIHSPVHEYDENIQKRVQRLFDALRPDRILCRSNANLHVSSELFTPKAETEPESRVDVARGEFLRSERQTLRKLPKSGAIVFGIHTYMVRVSQLSFEARSTLKRLEN